MSRSIPPRSRQYPRTVQAVSVEDPDSAASLASLGVWADALGDVSSDRNGPRLTAPSTTSWSARLVLCAMFANVLPGLREVRAPVVSGTLVLASLFIALALPSTPSRMTTRSSRAPSGFHPRRHQEPPSHPSRFTHRLGCDIPGAGPLRTESIHGASAIGRRRSRASRAHRTRRLAHRLATGSSPRRDGT